MILVLLGATSASAAQVRLEQVARFSQPVYVTISAARSLHLVQGNAGNHVDAWGAQENTLTFEFDVGNGGGTGTTNPAVTAGWQ